MSSYDISTISNDQASEIIRLKAQVDIFWKQELEVLKAEGIRDGMKVVEFGSAFGAYTEKLLATFPNATFHCVEADSSLVEEAKLLLSSHGARSVFEVADAESVDLSSDFDFSIARLLVEHLPNPAHFFTNCHNSMRPGGRFVCISNDFGWHTLATPNTQESSELYAAYCKARIDQGGDPYIGRKIPDYLIRAGFTDVSIRAVCIHSKLTGNEVFKKSEAVGIALKLTSDGYLDPKTLRKLIENSEKTESRIRTLLITSGSKSYE